MREERKGRGGRGWEERDGAEGKEDGEEKRKGEEKEGNGIGGRGR